MFLQKKKGIQTDQIGKGKTGRSKAIELIMKVATIFVPLTEMLSIYTNYSILSGMLRYAGSVIATAGDIVFVHFSADNERQLACRCFRNR